MFCLVYTSVANTDFGVQEIQKMLEKAREFNEQNEITGCLLFFKERFIQYIEGDEIVVKQLFDKIKNDSRNTDVTLLSENNIHNRSFQDWLMAFEHLKAENSNLQYLKLLVATYFENPENSLSPNPTSIEFWKATKLLLTTKYADRSV
ncbi:BLUF domain-containing protein [Zobellia amurskyensis]|uniref:BLUF domain-containing protein n=1 Tax=Zobellia amurskyensis TaxID=248905 RepID=A0A7X2ZUK7_9FLAO|nr:BLUF domain-containing protein [Zobellia amurskyensis]MUH36652.1 BLUF domain-containing protein [Zobellia amurskyensis]